ncbi:MAG TPA: SlyX family protein [Planctomycetes bacterium]|nr:SlyX family protein [Planctomycetota bacterium]HIL38204.1 SlyX family protein [Planctomycetota bacterium]
MSSRAGQSDTPNARIVELECRLTFLEENLELVSRETAAQGEQLVQLLARMETLVSSLRQGREGELPAVLDEAPPPHH